MSFRKVVSLDPWEQWNARQQTCDCEANEFCEICDPEGFAGAVADFQRDQALTDSPKTRS